MVKTIRVRNVPTTAFNSGREASSLLLSQVDQLQKAVRDAIDTEGEAADTIGTLTRLLLRLRPHAVPRSHQETLRKTKTRKQPKRKTLSHRRTTHRRTKVR
jgi:hypothetical protein